MNLFQVISQIKAFRKLHEIRIINFYLCSIAGIFAGITIAILFTLITDQPFNRWINISSSSSDLKTNDRE